MKPLLSFGIFLTFASLASATPVTWQFDGTINSVRADNIDGFGMAVTDPFSLLITFDENAADRYDLPGTGRYVSVGGATFNTGSQQITGDSVFTFTLFAVDGILDQFSAQGGTMMNVPWLDASGGNHWNGGLTMTLMDPSGLALSTDTLPQYLDVSDWSERLVTIGGGGQGTYFELRAGIDSITRVPDAGHTAMLLCLALTPCLIVAARLKPV